MDIILGKARRRWSDEEKRALVVETFRPGGSVSGVARRRGVSSSMLFIWRKQFRAELGLPEKPDRAGFATVAIAGPEFGHVGGDPFAGERSTDQHRVRLRRAYDGDGCRRSDACGRGGEGAGAAMIPVPSGVRVWIATGHTDMRRGMNSLALQIQQALNRDPHAGDLFVFRGKRGNLVKIFWADGLGASLYAKRLEKGRFVWPSPADGVVVITPAQLGYMLEGIDWRHPQHTSRQQSAG